MIIRLPALPRLAAAILVAGLAAGCVPMTIPAPAPDPGPSCGAERFGYLVGTRAARFDQTLAPGPVRIIRPGMAMTMDYRADRLNLETTGRGRITRVFCG